MPVINGYEAPDQRITPSEAGASTLARAGTEEARMGMQAGNSLKSAGNDISRGMHQVGEAITGYEDRAQAHTDSLAEVDFQNQQTQAEVAAVGGISDAATPVGSDGEPITDTPGRGGTQSLPPDAKVPSPGSFASVASKAIDAHAEIGEDAVARAAAAGASQKMQDHIAGQVALSNRRLQVHAAVLAGEVATTHLIHTTEQSVNTVTAGIDRDPSQPNLDNGLDQIHNIIGAARSSMTGNFAKEGAKHFEAAEQKARTDAITASAESLARTGRMDQANALLDDPKYNKDFSGEQREALKTKIISLGNQADEDSARKDAAQQRKEYHTMDAQMGEAIKNYTPGQVMPDFRGDPNWMKHPEKGAQLEAVYRVHEDTVLHRNQPDPTVSYQNADDLKKKLFDPTNNPDAVMDEARNLLVSKDPQHRINEKDYGEIQRLYSDPNARSLGKSVNDWLVKEGEGRIDPNLGAGPLQGGRSLLGQQQVQAWKEEFNRRAKADPANAHNLLDPTKPGNMVSNEALAPYRITESLKAKFKAQKADLDAQADAARTVPGNEAESGNSVMDIIKNGLKGDWFSSGAGDQNASAVAKIPGGATAAPAPAAAAPKPAAAAATTPAPVKTEADVQQLTPGSKFIIPEGPNKGKIGTVPATAAPADKNEITGSLGAGASATVGTTASSFASVIPKILSDEGGKTRDTGGFTNFGISAKAHPGVDIANLTKDKAIDIYKKKYWEPLKIDTLPDNMKHTVMDAAVNEGVGKARQMLAQAGNDPKVFNELRREHYVSLVENNPHKYARYLTGWMNRLGRIEREA